MHLELTPFEALCEVPGESVGSLKPEALAVSLDSGSSATHRSLAGTHRPSVRYRDSGDGPAWPPAFPIAERFAHFDLGNERCPSKSPGESRCGSLEIHRLLSPRELRPRSHPSSSYRRLSVFLPDEPFALKVRFIDLWPTRLTALAAFLDT